MKLRRLYTANNIHMFLGLGTRVFENVGVDNDLCIEIEYHLNVSRHIRAPRVIESKLYQEDGI